MNTSEKRTRKPPDPELHAISRILGILGEFPQPQQRERVLSYVLHRVDERPPKKPQLEILATPDPDAEVAEP